MRSASTSGGSGRTPTRSPRACSTAASTCSPAAPTRTSSSSTCARRELDGTGRPGAARGVPDHRQPQHGALRREAADGRLRRPPRHPGRHDARLRRERLRRGGRGDRRRAAAATRTSKSCAAGPWRSATRGPCIRASAVSRPSWPDARRRGQAPARSAQAVLPPRQGHADGALPAPGRGDHAAAHLRGDEGSPDRGHRHRDAARARAVPAHRRARRSPSARSSARASACSTAC